jgi:hypothetical protein
MLIVEDPIVSLVPDLPTYAHSEGSHCLAVLTRGHHVRPLRESDVRPKAECEAPCIVCVKDIGDN